MNQDGRDVIKDVDEMQAQSIQARARDEGTGGRLPLLLFLARAGQAVPVWWSKERDKELDRFWKNNDYTAGAFYTLASKLSSVPFRVEPRDPSIALHRKQAEEYQENLEAGSEFGLGWAQLIIPWLVDLWTQDNGAFMEVIGAGPKDGPIKGLPVGLAHLDSYRCHRTGSLEYPVQYEDYDGKLYKLHRTRVLYRSQMPSARAEMYKVGFCWLSRCINAAQSLTDDITYKQEKIGSRPQRGVVVTGGGLDPEDVSSAFAQADTMMDAGGLSRYSKYVIVGASHMPDARLDMMDLASLPDGFDFETDVTLGMYTIALAGAFPPRWLWPATVTGATKADAMYQHVAGLTGGPGATLAMIAGMLGGPERGSGVLPGATRFLPRQLSDWGPFVITWRNGLLCPFHTDVGIKNITCSNGLRKQLCGLIICETHVSHLPVPQQKKLVDHVLCYEWAHRLSNAYWDIPITELLNLPDNEPLVAFHILRHVFNVTSWRTWSLEKDARRNGKSRLGWIKSPLPRKPGL